ncbi:PH domain-containing protein [Maribacter orientalis]|uniref:PH domain-containing protein n=1 Tax=Maribacter orientalis TaxID=228957 RepID=A0A1H7LVP0_9FLAO|nr:PH domain-containing protein [Maribacter orientalis]SEL03026.1 PH domain-containing protein [Maribacter orientalis]
MKKYPSKIGIGLVIFIAAVLVGSTIPMISPPIWVGLIINLLLFIFIGHLFLTTYYVIDGDSLYIKSSFLINKKIDIKRVKKISETNTPLSAPAVSLDRLEIVYDEHGSILISPKDKLGFIAQMTRLNPEIVVQYKSKN